MKYLKALSFLFVLPGIVIAADTSGVATRTNASRAIACSEATSAAQQVSAAARENALKWSPYSSMPVSVGSCDCSSKTVGVKSTNVDTTQKEWTCMAVWSVDTSR